MQIRKSNKSFKQKATVTKGASRGKSEKKKIFHLHSIQIFFLLTNLTFSEIDILQWLKVQYVRAGHPFNSKNHNWSYC